MSNSKRLRVGVIGCGGIAQMMHLPYLQSLPDLFEIAALSDLSPGVLQAIGEKYGIPEDCRFTDYKNLLALDIEAALVLTGGNHHPQVLAAVRGGKHVFAEKPLCYTAREADEIIHAATQTKSKVMVGYMKRYDPGYLYAQQKIRELQDIRYVQLNTLHPAEDDFVSIHDILHFDDVPAEALRPIREAEDRQVIEAVGEVSPTLRALYADLFLGSLVHDCNALRGLLGEPEEVLFAELWPAGQREASITTVLKYSGNVRAVYTWTYLPELRDYSQEIAVMSPANRLRIQFPSPYLKNFPAPVVLQGMENGAAFEKRVQVSYAEAFREELIAFHHCIVNDTPPLTDASDARADIVLLQKIFAALKPAGLGGEAAQYNP
ncbi:MAG: Gfo/Idh/MocA family oxidoreductase [Chloroflexi bacterium]|nr:Gfo/Idh/MocA family oxidoreductase [Chloroflexota bacterium]